MTASPPAAAPPAIDILLATYNGAPYLPEQLASLEQQTFTGWRLIARDDGSSDGSLDLVREWAARTGRELKVIEDGRTGLGAKGNFATLLEASDAPYFACCDQDDVWLPEKLSLMHDRLREAEAQRGSQTPLLAYSDLRVVDAELRELHPSFHAFAGIRAPRAGRKVTDLLTQNVVTGCASLGNAALRTAALPVPPEAIMHDWWLALAAAATGDLIAVKEATALYRQHGRNAVGAVRWTPFALIRSFAFEFGETKRKVQDFLIISRGQAKALDRDFASRIEPRQAHIVQGYANLGDRSLPGKVKFCLSQPLAFRRPLRTSVMLIVF